MASAAISRCLFFLACFSVLVFSVVSTDTGSYDVCVIGGGGSGAASAVFLKDLGYSVKVIEKASTLGGHCNTIDFTGPDNQQYWLDIGVQFYVNTTNAGLQGFGQWSLDTVGFISRFVPSNLFVGIGGGSTQASFNADFLTGQILDGSFNLTEFQIAFQTLLEFVAQYPWLNTGERPDPLPPVFLEPFSKFISDNNLGILVDPLINGFTFAAGVGSLDGMSTLQGLWYQSPANLMIAAGQQYSAVSFLGGCQVLYDGIAAFLGSSAVTYDATISRVHRTAQSAVITGSSKSTGHRKAFSYTCGKVIVAVYPLLQNLAPWFDLTETEASLFSNLIAQGYLAMAATFTEGSLVANQGFIVNNFDPTQQPYNLPQLPNLSLMQRGLPFGPAAAWVNAETTCTPAEFLLDVAYEQFAGIPSQIVSNVEVSAWNYHQYGPHWTTAAEATSPSPNTRLINLQGHRNTYWVGAGVVTEGSHVVWNHAYKLITNNFPVKH